MTRERTPEPFTPRATRTAQAKETPGALPQGAQPRRVSQPLPPVPGELSSHPLPTAADLGVVGVQMLNGRVDQLEQQLARVAGESGFAQRREALRVARRHVSGSMLVTELRVELELRVARFLLGEHEPDAG